MKDDQGDLFGRKFVRGSATSRAAMEAAEPAAGTQRAKILTLLREVPSGLTDEQMQDILDMNPSTQRPRRVELVEAGLVRDSGIERRTHSGRKAVVWQAVPKEELDAIRQHPVEPLPFTNAAASGGR